MRTSVHTTVFFVCVAVLFFPATSFGLKIGRVMSYRSTVSSDAGGPLDLKAELNYNTSVLNAPIVVVMHGYSPTTTFNDVRLNAQRLRDAGFFAISVAMRGRDGSDGVRDSGGIEIFDIYDAVEAAKTQYAPYVNPANISITGYSGGGGNVMSTLTKFPDYFRAGSSYFGMSDYGYSTIYGWFFLGAASSHKAQLITDIGDPQSGNPDVLDRYMARDYCLASHNNPYSEIHLFVNYNEAVCPPINHSRYRDNAVSKAGFAGEFNNISVHVGGYGQYVDFDGDLVSDSNELQNWPHGFPTAEQQNAAEGWYIKRLKNGQIPEPTLNLADELIVPGFIKTKRFSLWLGNGQNAAGRLDYSLSSESKEFSLDILTYNKSVKGILTVNMADMAGKILNVNLNGVVVATITAQGEYTYNNFGDGDTLSITEPAVAGIAGDIDNDNDVDMFDFALLAQDWLKNTNGPSDVTRDGIVNYEDLLAMANNWHLGEPERICNFELNEEPGWQMEGEWEFGIPLGFGGDEFGYPDPLNGFTGTNVYGVNLNGDYSRTVGGPYYLTAGPFDCSDYNNISLKFARWLNTDTAEYVECTIEISIDGSNFQTIWMNASDSDIVENQWTAVQYDVSQIANNQSNVYIRWGYKILNKRAFRYSGWNIDDIEIWGQHSN